MRTFRSGNFLKLKEVFEEFEFVNIAIMVVVAHNLLVEELVG